MNILKTNVSLALLVITLQTSAVVYAAQAGPKATVNALQAEIANRVAVDEALANSITNISLTPGPQGEQGIQGLVGANGEQGVKGDTGPQGVKGDKGLTGEAGPAGIRGIDGADGPQGIQGLTGEKGDQGIQGLTGNVGATGLPGLKGETGATGRQGESGANGATGPAGPAGANGTDGQRGQDGLAGTNGANGAIGETGPQGQQGHEGPMGPAGPAGSTTVIFNSAPTVNDDMNTPYTLGSIWIDTSAAKAYILVDSSAGAAVWTVLGGSTAGATLYAIGDFRPAGGIVFHVTDGGLHGLEVAAADQEPAPWGCQGTLISGATGTGIGTGEPNTQEIIAGCNATTAASVASAYGPGWYLPSIDELNLLYAQRAVVGGLTNSYYWSSSQYDSNHAWNHGFYDGAQIKVQKFHTSAVRAVRAF